MPVSYILFQCGAKMGLDPTDVGPDGKSGQRSVLIRYLNEAARELYTQFDMEGSMMEQVFKVNGDQTITVPSYVGKIRAVREYASMQVWHINQMRPRYNQFNWPDMWRNYRLKNKQALMVSVTNESFGVLTTPIVENPPIVVTLSGPTTKATLAYETVTMNATKIQSQNIYTDYNAVKKDRVNLYDITLSDVDGKLLTVIPNNVKEAQYQILDISTCPWLPQNTSPLDNYVEILYKQTLPYLYNDSDEFPAFDYDDVIVNKMMQLWAEDQNKVDIAAAFDAKASRTAARIHEDQNRATEDMIALVANMHDTMLKRIGTGLRRRYSLYAGRKY